MIPLPTCKALPLSSINAVGSVIEISECYSIECKMNDCGVPSWLPIITSGDCQSCGAGSLFNTPSPPPPPPPSVDVDSTSDVDGIQCSPEGSKKVVDQELNFELVCRGGIWTSQLESPRLTRTMELEDDHTWRKTSNKQIEDQWRRMLNQRG